MNTAKRRPGKLSSSCPEIAQRLQPHLWPDSDRVAWEAACKAGRGLDPAGAAAHLRRATRHKHAQEWGCYLRFLSLSGSLLDQEGVHGRLTPARLLDYIRAISTINRPSTVRCRVIQLSYVAATLVPATDWSWVRRHPAVPSESEASASRKVKAFCEPRAIVAKALKLADGAEAIPDRLLSAVRYRDGILLALAFWSALRRKNLAELRIGHSLHLTDDNIRIVVQQHELKNGKLIDIIVPKFLAVYLRRYISEYRETLLQGTFDSGHLWINLHGLPLSYAALYGIFTKWSVALVNQKLHPHSTRYSLATALLDDDPLNLDLAAYSLAHKGQGTVERYYNQAGPAAASGVWQSLLERKRASSIE